MALVNTLSINALPAYTNLINTCLTPKLAVLMNLWTAVTLATLEKSAQNASAQQITTYLTTEVVAAGN